MTRKIWWLSALALVSLSSVTAQAAVLEKVDTWDSAGVPSTVSMYVYAPAQLAEQPPIVVLVHFCGGSAAAVFGQAQGGGLVAAANEHGFVLVVPQAANTDGSGRCWDVGSAAALTRDGGGDTEAIIRMVDHALAEYSGNPERVYVTGTSSGGMTTQALLALYPDRFRAGTAHAGVPAGCWAVGNPSGGWSGACAGGNVVHTPAEWGDIARAMHPGYTGPRPRVQLLHGDADDIILFQNHLEAIDQWRDVLGLDETPTYTDTVQLGSHQATRQRWEDECGYVVLDAFTSLDGDHGPSDGLFLQQNLVPFFGLDDEGLVDPHVATCGAPGSGGTGGTSGAGGAVGSGGSGTAGPGSGGAPGTGGDPSFGTGGATTPPMGNAGSGRSGGCIFGGVPTGSRSILPVLAVLAFVTLWRVTERRKGARLLARWLGSDAARRHRGAQSGRSSLANERALR